MGKIVRYEFLGSRWVFLLYCITVIGIPFGILYLLGSTVEVHEDLEDPTEFLEHWRAGRRSAR